MEVEITHHVDEAPGDPTGQGRYEYERYEFRFPDRIVWARRYVWKSEGVIAVMGSRPVDSKAFSLFDSTHDYAAEIADELHRRGFRKVKVLTEHGYRSLHVAQSETKP